MHKVNPNNCAQYDDAIKKVYSMKSAAENNNINYSSLSKAKNIKKVKVNTTKAGNL